MNVQEWLGVKLKLKVLLFCGHFALTFMQLFCLLSVKQATVQCARDLLLEVAAHKL